MRRLGDILTKRNETNEAVTKLQSALKQARILFHENPHVIFAKVLYSLGVALIHAGKFRESLKHLQDAKEMMENISGPNCAHHVTYLILFEMGKICYEQVDLPNALKYYIEAFDKMSEINEESNVNDTMASVCLAIGDVATRIEDLRLAKEYYIKANEIYKRISSTANTCHSRVDNLHKLGMTCDTLREQDEALKYLKEAREIAKAAGLKNQTVIHVLLQLSRTYEYMGFVAESELYFEEFKEIGQSLSTNGCLGEVMLKLVQGLNIP